MDLSELVKLAPMVIRLIATHGLDITMAAQRAVQQLDKEGADQTAVLGSFVGTVTKVVPELRALEPQILAHIQSNADAAIGLQGDGG